VRLLSILQFIYNDFISFSFLYSVRAIFLFVLVASSVSVSVLHWELVLKVKVILHINEC